MATKETASVKGTLPQPPFFTIKNINNLRDCAAVLPNGLPTRQGRRIRLGILFRSAEPSRLDLSGWLAVRRIGVARVFDLRSLSEVQKGWRGITGEKDDSNLGRGGEVAEKPDWINDMEKAGVVRSWVPIFEASDYSPARLAERYSKYMDESVTGFVEAYRDILEHAGPSFSAILRYLANLDLSSEEGGAETGAGEPKGALIHCTAGKDRTGIFFGVLLEFLGVERGVIAEEYQLTELGLSHVRDEFADRLMLSSAFTKYINDRRPHHGRIYSSEDVARSVRNIKEGREKEDGDVSRDVLESAREAALRMVGARRESMLGALDMVERVWGGAEAYFRDVVGLSGGELEGLRRNLVVRG